MSRQYLYRLLQRDNSEPAALVWRGIHHTIVAAGLCIMVALTVAAFRDAYGDALTDAFDLVALFFVFDYALRFYAAAGAPGSEHRGVWRSRWAWLTSFSGIYDLAAAVPGLIALPDSRDATLIGFIWVFKFIRYSAGLSILERVLSNARHALASVLLGLVIVLLAAASLAYLFERDSDPAFSSIPAALWWAITTVTTTGYGDVVPHTTPGRMVAGVVMVCGIMVFALLAGILASAYTDEMRRREFLRTWELVAKVPFFHNLGAALIAEVARLLRVRSYTPGTAIVRRGENGDCMFFVVEGEVEVELHPHPLRLEAGAFFGELALLTGAPRNATIVAVTQCVLLTLDIADFFDLISRRPELARVIHDEAVQRLPPGTPMHAALKTMIARDKVPVS